MKKSIFHSILVLCIGFVTNAFAQTPNAIPYQAVARNSSGNLLVNQNVRVRFSIHDVTATGTIVYQESQTVATNNLGLFTVNIGQGIVSDGAGGIGNSGGGIAGTTSGAFASVNWGTGLKFTQVEIDVAGGTNYVDMGTQQMMSVPYALYAANANVPGVPGPQGPAGNDGETGPQGADGAQGPEGPTGLLSAAAAAGNTPYWNGSSWVINSSNLFNNGGNIGIGTAAPNTSAALDINSTSGSLLIPRMTTTQRNILTETEGMVIYNTTDMKFQGCINVNTPSSTSVDQAQLNYDNGGLTNDQSQSFTAGITGELTSARVLLNNSGPPQTATVFIRSGLGNAGAILYQTTVTVNYQFGGAWYTINPTGVSVTAGGTYTINIINNGGGGPLGQIDWFVDQGNPYAGGSFYNLGMEPTSWDEAFETTVSTPSSDILQWANLNAAESVSGPAGNDGATGSQGPAGNDGATGATGNNGQSAYQVWLNLGNSGTEAVFIASLTGPQGPAGNDGATGPQGPIGLTGATGPQGTSGNNGATGPTGPQGSTGATGAAGPAYTGSCGYHIGQNVPALGGYIFYLDPTGCHGLVCSTVDNNVTPGQKWHWGSFWVNCNAYGNSVGSGRGNSDAMVNYAANSGAVSICFNYLGGNLNDWYLPSKYELYLMYANVGQGAPFPNTNVGGFATDDYYWSSTEKNVNFSYCLYFSGGIQLSDGKANYHYVRAVRAF